MCYSWWVLASLKIIGRLHWIDREKLRSFILACQDEETGGFADRPGDMASIFLTCSCNSYISMFCITLWFKAILNLEMYSISKCCFKSRVLFSRNFWDYTKDIKHVYRNFSSHFQNRLTTQFKAIFIKKTWSVHLSKGNTVGSSILLFRNRVFRSFHFVILYEFSFFYIGRSFSYFIWNCRIVTFGRRTD